MSSAILRQPQVCEITGLSSATIYRHEKAGNFPQRVRLGVNAVGWYESEVRAWVESRPRGGADFPAKAVATRGKRGKAEIREDVA